MYPEINLEAFQGPMDLLLYLIEKNKLDIYDIPIAQVTDQYLEYLQQSSVQNLESISAFIVMAARLLELKARSLIPALVLPDGEEDSKEELSRNLLEYKLFKEVSQVLAKMEEEGKQCLYPCHDLPEALQQYTEPVEIAALLEPLSLEMLYTLYQRLERQKKNRTDAVRGNFNRILEDAIKIDDKIDEILQFCEQYESVNFNTVIRVPHNRMEIVTTFLAMLELSKTGQIMIMQEEQFGAIIMQRKEGK